MSGKRPIVLHDDLETFNIKKSLLQQCKEAFVKHFEDGNEGKFFAAVAPGRVNLIGEHVDYCDGVVLPMAIPLYTMAYGRKASDSSRGYTMVYSSFNDEIVKIHRPYDDREVPAGDVVQTPEWASYVRGVLALYPHTVDMDITIESTIPVGGGLSSSAALELATLFLIRQATDLIDDDEMRRDDCAVLCRRAENIFARVPCGIMDQMVVALAEKDHALKIDCRNLKTDSIPISAVSETAFMVIDCGVRHKLASSEYGKRRQSVEDALRKLDMKSWRDVPEETLHTGNRVLEGVQMEHALHVVSETRRADEAANALLDNNLLKFGQLMNESHISLKDRYRVTCKELDELVEHVRAVEGVFGSRMTGGGFGGCTITMVKKDHLSDLKKYVMEHYKGGTPKFYECWPVAGVEEFPVDDSYLFTPSDN